MKVIVLIEDNISIIKFEMFKGIDVHFIETKSDCIFKTQKYDQQILEITHCKNGRFECEFKHNRFLYIREGEIVLNTTFNLPIKYFFPLKNYYGVSITINRNEISDDCYELLKKFYIDIDFIIENLNSNNGWFTLKSEYKMENIFQEIYDAKGDIEYLRIKVIELFHFVMKINIENLNSFKKFSGIYVEAVKEIRNKLIENMLKSYTLEEITQKYNISLTLFNELFKNIYGDTPYQYVKKYNMNRAANIIKTSDMPIIEIANEVGYTNPSKFSKAFKDVFGVTPKIYRKRNEVLEHF